MIEWHKVTDELPPYDTTVRIAVKAEDRYASKNILKARLLKAFGDNVWYGIGDWRYVRYVEDNDQWAYINLPEKDGDSD
jgi:hypothetical protein